MMRILLTGKAGQVGFELQRSLALLGELVAFDRLGCDLADENALRAVIRSVRPDIIVNPAAYTSVDNAEDHQDSAMTINGRAPGIIGEESVPLDALVVHYSTDYIFDGAGSGYYTEADEPNPQNVYGRSKLAGENALRASGARHLIFRTSWVLGVQGSNFAKTILRLAGERQELKVVADQIGAPTSARLIADVSAHALRDLMRDRNSPKAGTYHLVASGETSWHGYAQHVIEAARRSGRFPLVGKDAVFPISAAENHTVARRPSNSRLDTSKLRNTFSLVLPSWQDEVDHVLQQIM